MDASYITDAQEVSSNASFTHVSNGVNTTKDNAWQVGVSTNVRGFDLGLRYLTINTTNSGNIWGAHAGYNINAVGYKHVLGFDYEAANKQLAPLDSRWSVAYNVALSKNLDAEFKYTAFSSQKLNLLTKAPKFDPKLWTLTLVAKF